MANPPREWVDRSAVRLDRQDPYLRLQSVTIFVRDLDRSLNFYLDQLGFQLIFDARVQPGRRWVTVAPPDGAANLTLVAPEAGSEQYKLIGRPPQVTFVTEDVIAKFREWSKRGVRFSFTPRLKRLKYEVQVRAAHPTELSAPITDHAPIWGGVFTRFRDLDGNSFSLVSFDEVTHAVEAQRRAISEKLESERRVIRELEIAKEVQSRLFPQFLPPLSTLDYAGTCIQARQVGGDYYDFLDLGSPQRLERGATRTLAAAAWHLAFVLADISGKGIAGALLMANLQANLRSRYALALDDLPRLLKSVNQLFYENSPDDRFATLFFAVYDDHSGEFEYANCGHNAALLFRADGSLERLASTSTVIGVFPRWECATRRITLAPGDLLVIYTDGVTEAFNDADDEFGEHRLVEALRRHRDLSPEALLSAVVDEVRGFSPHEQHDDITLIIAKHKGR